MSGLLWAASLAQWRACWVSVSVCGWAYPLPVHLCWNAVPLDPKTLSREKVEENCRSVVGHVTGDEKYECVIWKESIIWLMMAFGSVYCDSLRGSLLGVRYLYLWYNHTTSCSNDCVGGSRLCCVCDAF